MTLSKMMKLHVAMSDKMKQQIAEEIGIGASTLARIVDGKSVDQGATIKIINWLFGEEK